jgi:hypothetical protein
MVRDRSGTSGAELEHDRPQPELLDGASSRMALVRQLAQRRRKRPGAVLDESSVAIRGIGRAQHQQERLHGRRDGGARTWARSQSQRAVT